MKIVFLAILLIPFPNVPPLFTFYCHHRFAVMDPAKKLNMTAEKARNDRCYSNANGLFITC